VEFSAAADELYGVDPADFVATRQRLADGLPAAEGRRLKALRRPTVPAWAVNLLVRDGRAEPLLDLGERMREAWSAGGDLGALEQERTTLVEDLVRRARTLAGEAGRPLSEGFAGEVEATLRAAIADPAAADTVRAGRLERPLSHAGFGPLGSTASTAELHRRPAGPRGAPAAGHQPGRGKRERDRTRSQNEDRLRARREAKARREEETRREKETRREEEARAAARRAEEAGRSLAEWESALASVRRRLAAADERLGGLREQVKAAEAERAGLDRETRVAEREHGRASRTADEARRRARELREAKPDGRHGG
jgi:hypothetical protein